MKGPEVQQIESARSPENHSDSDPLLPNQTDCEPSSSQEISILNDDDIENVSVPCCRICLETDCESGTQQFVHRSCLDHWRSVKEGFAFCHCTTCKAQFHLRVSLFEDNSWRKMKFRIFVTRDVVIVFLAVQTVIAAMGGFAYLMDKDGTFRNSFNDGWDRMLSKHPIPFYYCIDNVAKLFGFFLVWPCFSWGIWCFLSVLAITL